MILDQNHGDISWENIPKQFNKSKGLKSLVLSIHKPFYDEQKAIKHLVEKRSIEASEGKQLDGIGQILRQPRQVNFPVEINYFGFKGQPKTGGFNTYKIKKRVDGLYKDNLVVLPDYEYRKILYWRIAVLTGSGTSEDIHKALQFVLDIDEIRIQNLGNANVAIWISIKNDKTPSFLHQIKELTPVAAGVGSSFSVGKKNTFGFKEQGFLGFSKGSISKKIKEER